MTRGSFDGTAECKIRHGICFDARTVLRATRSTQVALEAWIELFLMEF